MSTEKPAPRRKRATTQPMWQVTPERAVSRQLASVTDESWGDVAEPPPAAVTTAKPAAIVATKATGPVKAAPAATMMAGPISGPASADERPKLKSVTSIAAALSGRVTRPIDAVPTKVAAKPAAAPAKVEAKPAPAKVEAKPAPANIEPKPAVARVELKPLRPLAPLKPVDSKPLPALRPLATTAPIAAQKPVDSKPLPALRPLTSTAPVAAQKPIEAPKPIALKSIEAPKPAPKLEPVKPIAPLRPILAAELPALPKVKLPGMPERRLAEGSIPPPTSSSRSSASQPLPSLFSVIDRKRSAQGASTPRANDLPRPKVAVSVVAGALTAVTPLAPAAAKPSAPTVVVARQAAEEPDDEPDFIPLSVDDLIEDAAPELLAAENFIPNTEAVLPAPLPPAPRIGMGSGVSFSALEESFFAAGDELDTGEQDALEPETFDDLPPVERAGFWSRLRSSSART